MFAIKCNVDNDKKENKNLVASIPQNSEKTHLFSVSEGDWKKKICIVLENV